MADIREGKPGELWRFDADRDYGTNEAVWGLWKVTQPVGGIPGAVMIANGREPEVKDHPVLSLTNLARDGDGGHWHKVEHAHQRTGSSVWWPVDTEVS